MNFNYRMRFSKTGRARFIAHLDTLGCLVRAISRTGYDIALTQGMRPKPILSLAMPLGVGVEGEDEICDFAMKRRIPLTEFAKKLNAELPEGIRLKSISPCFDRTKSAARVTSVSYRIDLKGASEALREAAERYNLKDEMVVLRKRPKGDKAVDIRKYVERVQVTEGGAGVVFSMNVTPEGTARPEEIMGALSELGGEEINASRIVRTAIVLKEDTPPPVSPVRGRGGPRRGYRVRRG